MRSELKSALPPGALGEIRALQRRGGGGGLRVPFKGMTFRVPKVPFKGITF